MAGSLNMKKLLLLITMIITLVGCGNTEPTKTEESLNELLDNIKEQQTHINISQNTEKTETYIEPFDNESIGQAMYSIYDFNGKDIMVQPWTLLDFSISNVMLHFQTIYDFSFEEGLFEDGWELVNSEGTIRNYEKVLNEKYTRTIKVDIRNGVCYEFSFKEPYNYTLYTMTSSYTRGDTHLSFGKPDFAFIDERDIIDYYIHPTGRYMIEIRYRYALDYEDASHSVSDMISIKYFDENIIPELEKKYIANQNQ